MSHIALTTLLVEDYDEAIAWFTSVLGFEVVEDTPSLTTAGRPKRWVVVRPVGASTGLLLAETEPHQHAQIGRQCADRVGFFMNVDDFEASYRHMCACGVEFLEEPRTEQYGRVVVFKDVSGNRWDLLGPAG